MGPRSEPRGEDGAVPARHVDADPDGFVRDPDAWERGWEALPALVRENAMSEVRSGRAASDPRATPFAVGLDQSSWLGVVLGGATGVMVSGVQWAVSGAPWPAIGVGGAAGLVVGLVYVLHAIWVRRAARERNLLVLEGVAPESANQHSVGSRWSRVLCEVGTLVTAFMISIMLLWAASLGVAVVLTAVGVDREAAEGGSTTIWVTVGASLLLTVWVYRVLRERR